MKKHLLLGSALLAAISAFPQNGQVKTRSTRIVDMSVKMAQKYKLYNSPVETSPFYPPVSERQASPVNAGSQARTATTSTAAANWNRFTGSENIYGMLVSNSKPLQYNDELGAVSFVHRKSHTYQVNPLPIPTASTGVIAVEITADWGATWDSTALWSNNTNWARYPQGTIYNTSPTNTSLAQAYIVGSGPTTSASDTWQGNWFASKQLDNVHGSNYNNVPSAAPGAQQFIANFGTGTMVTATNPGKVDFARLDMCYTDDGKVYAIGNIMKDANGTTFATQSVRGARVLTGTFNATTHTFDWSGDSIIPPVITHSDTHPMIFGDPHMAWKEDGSVGYVFFIGCRQNATLSNMGNQPIVYMKTASTSSWTPISGIDFNSPAMGGVKGHLPAVITNTTLTIPFFNNISEGIDGIVDANGNLHIMTTIQGTSASDPDSLNSSFQAPNFDGENYSYEHTPGRRPYIYDFVCNQSIASNTASGNPWTVMTVDSMSSEAPGWARAADDGFANNPWDIDPTNNQKINIDSRLQMSRTPDGKYIVYTWAESDTTTSNNGVKWNYNPNVKARLLSINGSVMTIHPTEINITAPTNLSEADPEVRGFAYTHYASPKCMLRATPSATDAVIVLPLTVSNNIATGTLRQREPVNHYYASASLTFTTLIVGIAEERLNSAKASVLYPNPAKGNAYLAIDLKDNSAVSITVNNLVGQQVKSLEALGQVGQNTIAVDLNGLSKGIYLVQVKAGISSSTKKLVVE